MVATRTLRSCANHRVTGLAAEMAFFALLSIIPLLVAVGAALGYLSLVVDFGRLLTGKDLVVDVLRALFGPEITEEVLEPLVVQLLFGERGGLALSSAVITLYLASRVFVATIRALDLAYAVEERRGAARQRLIALVFAIGFVIVLALTVALMVLGPLLGNLRDVVGAFGLSTAFEFVWAVVRGPFLGLVVIAFLTVVYRFGPNVRHRWRHCLPGAVLGVVLWLLASVAFRLYLEAQAGRQTFGFVPETETVGRVIAATVATVVWTFLTSLVILLGGEFNADLARERGTDQP